MAYIGLYGVYYSKATMGNDGNVASYTGVEQMGKAISASFEPNDAGDNNLYANNNIAETDSASAAGGTLTLTLDKLTLDAYEDLFGVNKETVTVTVGGSSVTGTGFNFDGTEASNTVGVAFIRQKQESNDRGHHEAVIYSAVTFMPPSEEGQTMGESIEWQTPEIEGTVTTNTGALPWCKKFEFPTQAAAEQFITNYFAAP